MLFSTSHHTIVRLHSHRHKYESGTVGGAHTLSHLTVLGLGLTLTLSLTLTLTLGSYCDSLSLLGAKVYEPPVRVPVAYMSSGKYEFACISMTAIHIHTSMCYL